MQTLVKRRSDGGIQEWSIEVQGNGFRVTAGKQGGKQRVNEWTYCKGKNQGKSNETTDEEQAEAEAQKEQPIDFALRGYYEEEARERELRQGEDEEERRKREWRLFKKWRDWMIGEQERERRERK